MTNRNRNLLAGALALLATAAGSRAADRPAVTVEVTPWSQYVWRGAIFTADPALQTSTTVSYRGAHLNLFTNQDLTNVNGRRGKFNETDLDAGYDYSREKVTFSGGVVRYMFPNTPSAPTTELYAGISSSGILHPSVRGYFDVDAIHGAYVTFDVSHSVQLPQLSRHFTWSAALGAGAGFGSSAHNAAYYGVAQQSMADLHPMLSLPMAFGRWTVTPRLAYSLMLDSALRAGPAAKAHGFYGGVSVARTF